jgi:hypothetical protein
VAGVVVGLEVVVLLKWGMEIVLLLESELVQSGVWRSGWSEDWCSCSSCDCLSGAGWFGDFQLIKSWVDDMLKSSEISKSITDFHV